MNAQPSDSSRSSLRVMSYNIRHARGMDGVVNVRRIADVINGEKPDIVGLQEVDRGVERTNRRDLPRELAEATGLESYFWKNITFEGGDYGNAVLSRIPMVQKTNTHLPVVTGEERKGAIQIVFAFEGRRILFVNTHIDHGPDETERLMSVAKIRDLVEGYSPLPAILCGDFNARPDSETRSRMAERFCDVWAENGAGPGFTFRSDNPDRRIDYIWISRSPDITIRRVWVGESDASDHLPLVADLQIG